MATKSLEDRLLRAACQKLHNLIHTPSTRFLLEAFVLGLDRKYYAVRVKVVSNRPVVVHHLSIYNADGAYIVTAMVTESLLDSLARAGSAKARTNVP